MKFVEIDEKQFAKYRKNLVGGGFYQRAERKAVRERMGWKVYFLAAVEGEKIEAAGFVMGKDGGLILQLGPLMKEYDVKTMRFFVKELVAFAKEQGYVTLEVYPDLLLSVRDVKGEILKEFDQKKTYQIFEDFGFCYKGRTAEIDPKVIRWMTVKDLSGIKDLAEAQATYKKNVRNKLRKISSGLKIHVLTDKSELREWMRPLDSSNHKNGVESWGRGLDYYEDIWDAFGDQVSFMEVRLVEGNQLVSSRMVFNFPDETETFSSGTIQELRHWNGMTYMQDWQIGECLKAGQKRLNFYGVAGDFSDANRLLEFKSGFGVTVEEGIGGFMLVLDARKYRMKQLRRKVRGAAGRVKRLIKK